MHGQAIEPIRPRGQRRYHRRPLWLGRTAFAAPSKAHL